MKRDLREAQVDVRAIDVGYFNTKYTLGRDGQTNSIKAAMFPSLAPRVPPTQITAASGLKAARGWMIAVGGVDYLVGPGSDTQITGSEPRPVDDDYCMSDKYEALTLGALNHMAEDFAADDGKPVDSFRLNWLVLGLPLTTYMKYSKKLQAKMTGERLIRRAGGEVVRTIEVEHVHVMVQPHGSLARFGSNALKGMNVVVDPGGGTLDWFISKGKEANWARSGSYPKAMLHCAQAVAECIDSSWRNQFDIMQVIDEALRNGEKTFKVGTTEYDMSQYRGAVDAVLEEAVKTMLEKTGSLQTANRILFVGGGARLFYEHMRTRFPKLAPAMELEADAVYSNLYGFHMAGELLCRRRGGQEAQ